MDDNDDSGPEESTPVQCANGACDYGLNGDNLDWLRRPSIYSKDKDTESVHWFNLLAYDNRVADWILNNEEPIRDIMELPNSSFLPSPEEHTRLKKDFVILALRILTIKPPVGHRAARVLAENHHGALFRLQNTIILFTFSTPVQYVRISVVCG